MPLVFSAALISLFVMGQFKKYLKKNNKKAPVKRLLYSKGSV